MSFRAASAAAAAALSSARRSDDKKRLCSANPDSTIAAKARVASSTRASTEAATEAPSVVAQGDTRRASRSRSSASRARVSQVATFA